MIDAAVLRPAPQRRALFESEPLFAAAGLLVGLSLAPTLAAMTLDPRLFQGESVWVKPVKFQIALALYLLTLAFFARWLPAGLTRRRGYRLYAGLVVFAVAAELVWIGGAAMFGTASHYNVSSPLMAALYALMGVFAVLLTSASLVYGVAIGLNRAAGVEPGLRLALVLGLALTFLLTVPVAYTLASMSGHLVGTPVTGASVPVVGWSREVGDLRAPHFLATHAMHVLPLAGWLAVSVLAPRRAITAVWIAAVVYVAVVTASFFGALAGAPLVPA